MDVRETEEDILADLHELDDPVLQYAYLVACAGDAEPYPDSLRDDEHLVRECQVKTWIDARHHADGAVRLVGDSESIAIRGALALLEELFDGRRPEELAGYPCGLLDDEAFARHFTKTQLRGLEAIVRKMIGRQTAT